MKRLFLAIALTLAAPFAQADSQVPQSSAQLQLSFAPVVKTAAPAVVNIYAKRIVERRVSPFANDPMFSEMFRDRGRLVPRVENSLGSGVIVTPAGMVVSNYHVVGMATEIRVVLADRREFIADVLLGDKEADLAVLKLRGAQDLPALAFRDSDAVEVGDLVLAIGNPFGVGQTVSSGIVSGLARSGLSFGSGRGYFIQTDAPINPGNSGGALVDMDGRLVGVNTAILTRSGGSNGIGFAIPANLVRRYVDQALEGHANFVRPWAGITAQVLDAAMAEALGLDRPEGIVIADLHSDSPFRAAGLGVGDVIVAFGGVAVNTPQELYFRMATEPNGAAAPVEFLRAGDLIAASVTMMRAPETPPRDPVQIANGRVLSGLSVTNVNPAVAAEFNLRGVESGVMVVTPGPAAGRGGLRVGDILLNINGQQIDTTADVAQAASADRRTWTFRYQRGNQLGVLRFRL
ncbi:serine protease [Actibacterium mucosum KCTC 23349]|uniref:Serine protease n=1 Tax=Actibacterium mucosum KCTC 23349 TaxID=1454373 RepID=A0A037ZGY9_9RHOB|nr:trypsin-like peptidase domain-containing protein [Actibacterium mucosum]KAJ54801.1 serine protease [Actibacterium mucosum KCTC 23349]